jgi:hypothetical protein
VVAPQTADANTPSAAVSRGRARILPRAPLAERCANDGLRVVGLRFKDDCFVPGMRFEYLRQKLGDGFVAIELDQSDGNPIRPLKHRHSVLTRDLIDVPGEPTRDALDLVMDLFRTKLLEHPT